MNTNSPLIPQGSLTDQKPRNKSNVYIAVFAILGFHVVVLGALLLQGCKERPSATASTTPTNDLSSTMPPFVASNPPPVVDNTLPVIPAPTSTVVSTPLPPLVPATSLPVITPTSPEIAPASSTTEHQIAKNESFSTLAKKYGVKVDAIAKANPGVDSKKLKVGQKILIPERSATMATSTTSATPTVSSGVTVSSDSVYVVKAGDSLIKIAKLNSVSLKELRAANNLKTDRIHVDQKLKLPAKAATAEPAATPVIPTRTASLPPVTTASLH